MLHIRYVSSFFAIELRLMYSMFYEKNYKSVKKKKEEEEIDIDFW